MANLTYSDGAIEILHLFYRTKVLVCVEGREDIIFWSKILSDAEIDKEYFMKTVGGREVLIRIMKLILTGKDNLIVLADNDYSEMLATQFNHDRIVYTYGYSIENTLYCPNIIANIIADFIGSENLYEFKLEIRDWYEKFCDDCSLLLIYDLYFTPPQIELFQSSENAVRVKSQVLVCG